MPGTELVQVTVHRPEAANCADCAAAKERCIACEHTVCEWHRGYDKNSYVTWGHRKGYACCACIESGRAAHNSFADKHGMQSVEARVNRILDAKLRAIQETVAPTLIDFAVERTGARAQQLVNESQKQFEKSLDKVNRSLDDGAKTVKDAVSTLQVRGLLWQAGLVFGLVNVATVIAAVWIAKHM